MNNLIDSKCNICSESIVKCENTCSCLPCDKKNKDCKKCYNDIFYCFSCKIKLSKNIEMRKILIKRRMEKIEEIREIEKELGIFLFENDIMFQ
jgi:hypothetical protein